MSAAMGVRAAEKVMADAGFKTKVKPVPVNYIGIGFVVSTDPQARTAGPQGLDHHPLRGLTPVPRGFERTRSPLPCPRSFADRLPV